MDAVENENEEEEAHNNEIPEVVEDFSSPLITAALAGDLVAVSNQLKQGADKNETTNKGRTALWYAARNGHLEIFRLLLEKCADKDKADNDDETPLYQASDSGHMDIVHLLIEQGADIDKASRYGWTPLMAATSNGNVEVMRYLLEQGADREKADANDFTPLHGAALMTELEAAKLLMVYGADLNARTSEATHSLLPIDMPNASEEIRQAIRDEPRRRMDEAPGKRATEEDRHPTAATSASVQDDEAEEGEQSNKRPRLDGGVAEEEGKVAEEDEDSEPSDGEEDA